MIFSPKKIIAGLAYLVLFILLLFVGFFARRIAKRRYKLIVYKVDRLGDWILAEVAIAAAEKFYQGPTLLIVEKKLIPRVKNAFPHVDIIGLKYDGDGIGVAVKNLPELLYLATQYRCEHLASFRHQLGPLRQLTLHSVNAEKKTFLTLSTPAIARHYPWLKGVTNTIPETQNEFSHCHSKELLRHKKLLRDLGVGENVEVRPRYRAPKNARPRQSVMLAPYGSGRIRDLPDRLWLQLCLELREKVNLDSFEIWVDKPQEKRAGALAEKIHTNLGAKVSVNVAKDISELQKNIAEVKVVISVETAVAHISTAYDQPTFVFIGGGEFGQFGPWRWSHRQKWLTNRIPCFGCEWSCHLEFPECIHGISIKGFAEEANSLLKEDYQN